MDADFWKKFGITPPVLPGGAMGMFMRVAVSSSVVTRTIYEENLARGFTEDQALLITLEFHRHLMGLFGQIAQVLPEIIKAYGDQEGGGGA